MHLNAMNLNDSHLIQETTNQTTAVPQLTAASASVVEGWSSLSIEEKADAVMIELLMQRLTLSRDEAYSGLVNIKKKFIKLLDRISSRDLDRALRRYFSNAQLQQIKILLEIKKILMADPLKSYEEIIARALFLLQQKKIPIHIDELRLYQLREILNIWVDWESARIQLRDPLQALKAVMLHYNQPFPDIFFESALDLEKFPNVRFLHEAALLWNRLKKGDMFSGVQVEGVFSAHVLIDHYLSSLTITFKRQEIIDKLFISNPEKNLTQRIYFNGLTFKNAKDKAFADLVNCTELEEITEYKNLTLPQRQLLLKEKFFQIGESMDYIIGSLFHSLSSSLLRIFYYQFAAFPPETTSEKQLIDLFKETEERWEENKDYPIQPRLLLALHLADSNNITMTGNDWQEKFELLFNYLSAEFEKILPPHFDREKAATTILQVNGISLEELTRKRYYVIQADNPNLSPSYYGTPLEQFLKLADWDGIVGKNMYYKGKEIKPREALQKAEEHFNRHLSQSQWLHNKAVESLKQRRKMVTKDVLEQEKQRIVLDYEAETENYRAWIRGLKIWVNTIPIIGPLYTIEEGIRDRDPSEIISGIFFLSLDALDLLVNSEKEPLNVMTHPELKGLSANERTTVETLSSSFVALKVPISDLHLDSRLIIKKDSFVITDENDVPSASRFMAEQVRSGVQTLTWNDYPLIYLANENRVVPVQAVGGSFREINWRTGKVDTTKHLIFKDSKTGVYSTLGLLGGGLEELKLNKAILKDRVTVAKTRAILRKAYDFDKYNFSRHFEEYFSINREQEAASNFNALDFYNALYDTSPTFRRIFNRFVTKSLVPKKWTIKIKSGERSRTDFDAKNIYIASDSEISDLRYVSNQVESTNREQIYLHELLHALTNGLDPHLEINFRNRGPIVYLTDKILSEAGYQFKPQVMYKRPGVGNLETLQQHIKAATYLAAQEDLYLDRIIDERVPILEYTKTLGEPLAERYTVKEIDKIWRYFKMHPIIIDENMELSFRSRFLDHFEVQDINIVDFYANLYEESKDFSYIFEQWHTRNANQIVKWHFEIDSPSVLAQLPANNPIHGINPLKKEIYIFESERLYLSDKGLIAVEKERQLLHTMLQVLLDLPSLPGELALTNRGPIVQVTDKIFEIVKYDYPKQLAAALVLPGSESEALLLGDYLEVQRAALLEDKLIEKNTIGTVMNSFSFRRKRSISEKYDPFFFPVPSPQLSPQGEDIEAEKKKIQAKLNKYGILQGVRHLDDGKFLLTKKTEVAFSLFGKNDSNRSYNSLDANELFFPSNPFLVK